jgi:hypothetical protein
MPQNLPDNLKHQPPGTVPNIGFARNWRNFIEVQMNFPNPAVAASEF